MEDDLEVESAAEGLELEVEELFVFAWGIDMEWGSAAVETECAYHAYESEHMISMQMRDEYGIHLREIEA